MGGDHIGCLLGDGSACFANRLNPCCGWIGDVHAAIKLPIASIARNFVSVCIVTVLAVAEEAATRDEGFGDFLSLREPLPITTKIWIPKTSMLIVTNETLAVGLEEKIAAVNGVLARFRRDDSEVQSRGLAQKCRCRNEDCMPSLWAKGRGDDVNDIEVDGP